MLLILRQKCTEGLTWLRWHWAHSNHRSQDPGASCDSLAPIKWRKCDIEMGFFACAASIVSDNIISFWLGACVSQPCHLLGHISQNRETYSDSCTIPHLGRTDKKKDISSAPPCRFDTPTFASAYDPGSLKASGGLLHAADLCSRSRSLNPGRREWGQTTNNAKFTSLY